MPPHQPTQPARNRPPTRAAVTLTNAPPELVLRPSRPLGPDWPRDLALALKVATGTSWQVSLSDEPGEPSLLDQEKMAEERVRAEVLADPNVRAVMDAFPGAELESFTTRGS